MKRIITYGTFDLFHQGHYNILKRAKEEGDYLIVGVTADNYDMERGKISVQDSLAKRIENVRATGFADKIIVEEYLGQKISDIIKYNVDMLVVGSDWRGKFDHLKKYCEVKYLERTKNISSTKLREENYHIYDFGIVTDDLNDKDVIIESKHVSGFHAKCVFSCDPKIAKEFCTKYELDNGYSDYSLFLSNVDIVYICTPLREREQYIRDAIIAGKHVICTPPFTSDINKEKELFELARENKVLLVNGITTEYLSAFEQLLWMVRGNVIGDIISIKCSMSSKKFGAGDKVDFYDMLYYPVFVIIKCLGYSCFKLHSKIVKNDRDEPLYAFLTFDYDNSVASIEVGCDLSISDGMMIIGTEGSISVPDDWWQVSYFKLKSFHDDRYKRYSSNFDGNGFRYILQSVLRMIRHDKYEEISARLSTEELDSIMSVLISALH